MLVIPELQIEGGRLVTRISPDTDNTVHDLAPMDAVAAFEAAGAERLHVLDIDAALGRDEDNAELIRRIIGATHAPVQVAGGMRTGYQAEQWFEAGAAHVVLGTLAITDQALVAELSGRHPGGVLANLATRDGYVMIDGWRTQTAFRGEDIVYDLQMAGVAGIIHFDINRRDGDASSSLALTMDMKRNVVIPVYSSGTVRTLDDVAKLQHLPDIHGVIIGEALVTGTFTLDEAIGMASQLPSMGGESPDTLPSVQRMQRGFHLYLAAYNLSAAAVWWNEALRGAISDANPYIEVTIPQRDLELDVDGMTPRGVQAAYEKAIDDSDAVMVVLDGIENEAWTGFECGYARAQGKYLIGIATGGVSNKRARFAAMCDEVVTVDPDGEPGVVLETIAREVNSRMLADGTEL